MVNVTSVLNEVVVELLEDDENTVDSRSDINDGRCHAVAAEVYTRLGKPSGMKLCVDRKPGGRHYWIEYEGEFYDAERPEGVSEWRELPYWRRNNAPDDFEYGVWLKHTGM